MAPVLNGGTHPPGSGTGQGFYKYDITQSIRRSRLHVQQLHRQQDINLSAAHTLYIEQVCTLLASPLPTKLTRSREGNNFAEGSRVKQEGTNGRGGWRTPPPSNDCRTQVLQREMWLVVGTSWTQCSLHFDG